MKFTRIDPADDLREMIEWFWYLENDSHEMVVRKIVPDGFPEIIFQFADPYEMRFNDSWELQTHALLAGQLTRHFLLRNTGRTATLGIKCKPYAPSHLFDLSFNQFTDRVVDIYSVIKNGVQAFEKNLRLQDDLSKKVELTQDFLREILQHRGNPDHTTHRAIDLIFENNGTIPVADLASSVNCTTRHLQRLFSKNIGLSPKLYCRLIRFTRIFDLMKKGDPKWTSIAFDSGFYDQSHFIRDFKKFSGEEPGEYGFDRSTLANFFMKKGG